MICVSRRWATPRQASSPRVARPGFRPGLLAGLLAALLAALLAMAPATSAAGDTGPTMKQRTMPHLKFVCPAAIGDHKWAGLLPDGPRQEQCFYEDDKGSNFAVGASWHPTPNTPGDPYAVCPAPDKLSWQENTAGTSLTHNSATRRAYGYLYLNLYWPNTEKLARQRALLGQSKALADEMLAAAEKLAQPCVQPTPTETPEPSDTESESTDEPTETDSVEPTETTSSPEPSTSAKETLCGAIDGTLTGNDGDPVAGVVVRLLLGADKLDEDVTDGNGKFHLNDIPDTPEASEPAAARLQVLARDGDGAWRIYAGRSEASLEKSIPLADTDGCRHDLTTTSLDGYRAANPTGADDWADVWAIVAKTRRAMRYIDTTLGVRLRDLPILIFAWCPAVFGEKTCGPGGTGAFATEGTPRESDRADGIGTTGRIPMLVLSSKISSRQADAPDSDTMYHELGHLLQAELAGGFRRMASDAATNHAGYANPTSNDSFLEGFASWFAVTIDQADGRNRSYYAWENNAVLDIEADIKAWDANGQDEEWAVAGLLTDLVDRGRAQNNGQGRSIPFTSSNVGGWTLIEGKVAGAVPGRDVVVVELFDASGKRLASDDAYLFGTGRFYDVPTISFARARVFLRTPQDGTGRRDDDPFAMSPRELVRLLTNPPDVGTRGGRTAHASTVFDVAELHGLLRAKLKRAKEVDGLFVAHGFHENLKNLNAFARGNVIGMTTHPPFRPGVDPRYGTQILPQQYIGVDTGGAAAAVLVFPQDGVPYAVMPDDAQQVPLMIGGSVGSRAAVLTLAKDRKPAVTMVEGRTFWPEAAKHKGSFLTITPKLEPVARVSSGTDARLRTWVLVVGTGVALLAFATGFTLLGLSRRRRRSAVHVQPAVALPDPRTPGPGAWPPAPPQPPTAPGDQQDGPGNQPPPSH